MPVAQTGRSHPQEPLAAQERRSLGAILRTLGLRPAQLRQLTAWELAPIVAVALLVGAAAGLSIAALLVRSVDLASLTGSAAAPSPGRRTRRAFRC